jgi:hypothetical protein
MEFIKLVISSSERYSYANASNIKMNILGDFLISDVSRPSSFINWALDTKSDHACANLTNLEKETDYILMSDLYSEENNPIELKLTLEQFIQILIDWEEKVLKLKPKEVLIKYENAKFVIETKN